MITTEEIQYAKDLNNLCNKYKETHNFEDVLTEAHLFNEDAFTKTMENADQYNEWNYYMEEVTRPFRHYDIVDIAKVLRKEFKNEFGKNLKVRIKTTRHWSCDDLYITIKEINEDYLIPLPEYMEDYKRKYSTRHGIEHPYKNDETFERYAKLSIDRIYSNIYLKIQEIANLFILDNSDIMIDYFDRNYMANLKMEIDGDSLGGYSLL